MKKRISFIFLIVTFLLLVGVIVFPRGPRVANDFPIISSQILKSNFSLPYIWSDKTAEGMGEYAAATLWSWPLNFITGVLGILDLNFSMVERIFFIILSFAVGAISIRKLLDKFRIAEPGKSVGTLFYITTTYFLLLIDGGQLSIALTYAFFPLIFLLFINSIGGSFRTKLISVLAMSMFGYLDIRFVYLLGILIFIHFLYNIFLIQKRKKLFSQYFLIGLTFVIVFILLHLYWILPLVFVKENLLPPSYDAGVKSFTTLYHSLSLLQPNWYLNVFGKISSLRFEFVLIPILIFLAPIFKKRDMTVGFWLLVALVSVFLAKGTAPPFGMFYSFLYAKLPGFSLFRDSTKFFFLVALSYSVLLGITTNGIFKRVKIFPFVVVVYLLLLISPVYLGKMTGVFSRPVYEREYVGLSKVLQEDSEFGRVLWIPSRTPLGYSDLNHPYVEALRMVVARPFAIGRVGDYELFNFLREASYIGQILNISSIRYLVYPYPDIRREELKQDNVDYYHLFLSQISKLPWVEKVENYGSSDFPLPLIKVRATQDRFFVSPNLWGILGSDEIYQDLEKVNDFDLSRNALVYLEENEGLSRKFESSFGKVILYNKSELDLKASFIDSDFLIFPSKLLNVDPGVSGWWKRDGTDISGWRNFLQSKYNLDNLDFDYGGGWAVAEGKLKFNVEKLNLNKGDILLARVMKSRRGGKITITQGDKKIGVIDTGTDGTQKIETHLAGLSGIKIFDYDRASFDWVEVGNLENGSEITIETEGDINVVNTLAVVPDGKWSEIDDIVKELRKEGRIIDWSSIGKNKESVFKSLVLPSLFFKETNPTQYKVSLRGVRHPVILAFSETYDPNWKLENSNGLPLYSLINGFEVDKDGDYTLKFVPQKYVDVGFVVTLITIFALVLVLILL